jgi:hypothetical protein
VLEQMLARAQLPTSYQQWNDRWGAPHGKHTSIRRRLPNLFPTLKLWVGGPFAWQANSGTRRYEYPWVREQLASGKRVLEIGGALSGLQFAVNRELGCEYHNVDPFYDYGNGPDEYLGFQERHRRMNAVFGAKVKLHPTVLEQADIDGSFDAICCVSTIEHMPASAIESTLRVARELLSPGGQLVLTVDLFLNVQPFCSAAENRWGTNVSLAWIEEVSGLKLMRGRREELYGYKEFSTDSVLARLDDYLVAGSQLAQLAVFVK